MVSNDSPRGGVSGARQGTVLTFQAILPAAPKQHNTSRGMDASLLQSHCLNHFFAAPLLLPRILVEVALVCKGVSMVLVKYSQYFYTISKGNTRENAGNHLCAL